MRALPVDQTVATMDVGAVRLTVRAEHLRGMPTLGALARTLYRERRAREQTFPEKLFAEPNWDILLDLFASEVEGKKVSISGAAFSASIPMTTALRHLNELDRHGLIARSPARDRRRVYLNLTEQGRARMSDALARILAARGW